MKKDTLICMTMLSLSACSSAPPLAPPVITRVEVPHIPETLLMMPGFPAIPAPPRTNADMYDYRRNLENYTCELMYRTGEVIRFATLGQQTYQLPKRCELSKT